MLHQQQMDSNPSWEISSWHSSILLPPSETRSPFTEDSQLSLTYPLWATGDQLDTKLHNIQNDHNKKGPAKYIYCCASQYIQFVFLTLW